LGKFHPEFQQYLLDAEAGLRRRGPDHKAAGVRVTRENDVHYLGLLLQGHHGGLKNRTDLQRWYERCKDETETALSLARQEAAFDPPNSLAFPAFAETDAHSAEFFLRMLFSALVDADFLDTEAHFNPEKGMHRGSDIDVATLWRRFAEDQQQRFGNAPETTVNHSRRQIYDACLEAASHPPGLFRLTVPTGGGKTRSGMAFALRHALEHGQRRVVVAVPYITITQQTANEYRNIFNAAEDDVPVVLEHHSGTAERIDEADEYNREDVWRRLAAENWDAPIIVTTTVQLFESLFANSTSRCRKLHRLANSVIILDEAQTLPAHLLEPMLDALRELCAHYGSSVVLSTATQPAFDAFAPFKKLDAREIVPKPERHFQTLKRVQYEWRVDEPLSWEEVAGLMRSETQALAICNTKQDALDLLEALNDPDALHLSTLLCGAHRSAVIKEVRDRLATGQPCRLVATQVVEAGVDIDFPLVLRALGPLDSIIQAAGRANREGKLDNGRVIIFNPVAGGLPPGAYQRAAKTTITLLNSGPLDMHDPATMQRYFRKLYQLEDSPNSEGKIIQKKRAHLDYPEVARRFRLIKEDTVSVIITDYGAQEERRRVQTILARLRGGAPPTRRLLRQLQPYTISLYKPQADKYLNQGFLSPQTSEGIPPGIWEWVGEYDRVHGLSITDMSANQLVV
jgi:CRISPR-associated endonuclease/helicase Cas3